MALFTDANSFRGPKYLWDRHSLTLGHEPKRDCGGIGGTSMICRGQAIGASARREASGKRRLPWQLAILLALSLGTFARSAPQMDAANSDATSSRAARDEATRSIPWKMMS